MFVLCYVILGLVAQASGAVNTTSGILVGIPSRLHPAVSAYLGIPYAVAPVGLLRFAPPIPFVSQELRNVTAFGPSCPTTANGFRLKTQSNINVASPAAQSIINELGQYGDSFSEDCLSLNVWTAQQTGNPRKAVLIWIYGGGFQSGNSDSPQYDGSSFARDQDIVLVTLNYRLNIFGFPGLPGHTQNPGLLDQRLAVEWVRDNIAQFGGDPTKITLRGRPNCKGADPESGSSTSFGDLLDSNNLPAWYNGSKALGCGGRGTAIDDTLTCMRAKRWEDILAATAIPQGLTAILGDFGATVDNQTIFSNYDERGAAGNFARLPVLVVNTNFEAGIFKLIARTSTGLYLPDAAWAIFNEAVFSCPAKNAATYRASFGVPVWRYRSYGVFDNTRLSVNPDSGAYHCSDYPLYFNTAGSSTNTANSPPEAALISYLQGAWAAFVKDPSHGLEQTPYSWPKWMSTRNSLIATGMPNKTLGSFVDPSAFDDPCSVIADGIRRLWGIKNFINNNLGDYNQPPFNTISNLVASGGGVPGNWTFVQG